MLPDGHANKDTSASELRDRLLLRFRGELQDELGELSKQYTSFAMIPQEKVCSGIDRLNGIVQKMRELNQPPTDASTLAVLRNALQIPSLKSLWMAIALNPNPTYAELTSVCKRYDVAMKAELEEANFVTPDRNKKRDRETDAAVCSFCGKPGHVADKCFSRIKERKAAQMKRASRASEKEKQKNKEISGQKPGSKEYSGCHGCGSKKHVKSNCPKNKDKSDKSKKGDKKKDIQDFVRAGEDDNGSDTD
jgi:hypothetical protein